MPLSEALDTPTEGQPDGAPQGGEGGDQQPQAPFHWAEGVPGEGDVPEWFKGEKYKSVAEQARAYTGLELKLGESAKLIGAPEETEDTRATSGYNIAEFIPEGLEVELDPEDPFFQAMLPEFREMKLSQSAASRLAQKFVAAQAQMAADAQTMLDRGIEALGGKEKAAARLSSVMGFVNGNLPKDQADALRSMIDGGFSPEGFQALEQLVNKARGSAPAGPDTPPAPTVTLEEVRKMQFEEKDANGNLRFNTDPQFRDRVRKLRASIVGSEPFQQIVGGN